MSRSNGFGDDAASLALGGNTISAFQATSTTKTGTKSNFYDAAMNNYRHERRRKKKKSKSGQRENHATGSRNYLDKLYSEAANSNMMRTLNGVPPRRRQLASSKHAQTARGAGESELSAPAPPVLF